jgi:hypothetical protein
VSLDALSVTGLVEARLANAQRMRASTALTTTDLRSSFFMFID